MIGITGASGFIGKYLVSTLSMSGYNVVAYQRDLPKEDERIKNVEYRLFDMRRMAEVSFYNITHIIHCAYSYEDKKSDIESGMNFLAAQQLSLLARNGGMRLIFLSSLMVESNAQSLYVLQKKKIESLARHNAHSIIRLGLVLGNGGVGLTLGRMAAAFRIFPCIGNGKQLLYISPLSSIGSGVISVVDSATDDLITIAHQDAVPFNFLVTYISKRVKGRAPLFIRVPLLLLYASAIIIDIFGRRGKYFQERVRGLAGIAQSGNCFLARNLLDPTSCSVLNILDDFSDIIVAELGLTANDDIQ